MASPTPRDILATPGGTTDSTSFTAPLATHDVDDSLFAWIGADGQPSLSSPGWTQIASYSAAASQARGFLFLRDTVAASNAEADPVFTSTASEQFACVTFSVPGGALLSCETSAINGSSTTPNPPSLSPSVGSKDFLWLALLVTDNGSGNTITLAPSGYSGFETTANGVGAGCTVAGAYKQSTASSEDPQSFAATFSEQWATMTVAIWDPSVVPPAPKSTPSFMLLGVGS